MNSAAIKNDVAQFKLMLGCGVDVNRAWQDGRTPLHLAVRERNTGIIQLIIDYAVLAATGPQPTSPRGTPPPRAHHSPTPSSPLNPATPSSPLNAAAAALGGVPLRRTDSSLSVSCLPHLEVSLEPVDRWGCTPLEEARAAGEAWNEIAEMVCEGVVRVREATRRAGRG
ncbi:hypothetical protein BDK51DRAFT_42010 [Blyttiomyces helicus]|uniref:Uncharacterized protein n=1 Tax=Blyttiomyces helicus TaxID=388810 RepID=A0A4P9WT00_9FUNG|nr:hypothetical protein BDK51DRAFT_42010 [Blyttiomyces helicus]|eukprot:RKO94450.1 hypothetical protein BDK51DRAFT_42010 [Blyttiomyces helicus]